MKEKFQQIIAWAKEHPWLAGGILGGIVLVIWLAIRNGWLGGGGGGGGEVSMPSGDGGEGATLPDLANLPDTSALPPGVSEIGQSSEPIPVSLPNMAGGMESFLPDTAFSGFDPLPSYPLEGGIFSGAPVMTNQSAALINSAPLESFISSSPVAGIKRPQTAPIETPSLVSYISASPVAGMAKPGGGSSLSKTTSGKGGGKVKTPSQEVGKGAKFTGLYNGIYYVDGYPTSASNPGTQLGTGAISKSPVAKMRKPGM